MNWDAVQAIVRKDLRVAVRNKAVSIPLIALPVVILVGLPVLSALMPKLGGGDDVQSLLAPMLAALAPYDEVQKGVVYILVYMAAPIYLLMPLMVSLAGACDSFAGEKERKTLEALLYTPTTDGELLVGKLLSAWLPALGIAWGGFLLYIVMANLAAWPVIGRLFFPTAMWMVLALWVAPPVAMLGVGAMVLISSRTRTFQGAYQLGSVVVLPVVLLLVMTINGALILSAWVLALAGLLAWAIDAALLWYGWRSFRRTKLTTQV